MTEKYLATWIITFVNKVCKLESQAMSSELKLLEKVQNKKVQKTSNESARFRGVKLAT